MIQIIQLSKCIKLFISMGYILTKEDARHDDIIVLSAFYASNLESSTLVREMREKHFATVNPPNWIALGDSDLASPFLK